MVSWSTHQETIFNWLVNGTGSAIIEAVAGSGKTTTIVECAKRLPSGVSAVFVCFNRSVKEELAMRLADTMVRAMTLNGLGFTTWRKHLGDKGKRLQVDGNKSREILRAILINDQQLFTLTASAVCKMVGLSKSIGLVPAGITGRYYALTQDTEQVWLDMISWYDIEFDDSITPAEVIRLARMVLTQSIQQADSWIDFDDQLYMPVIARARFWRNDYLFVDEAQDINHIQREMLRMALNTNGRLIAVGDPHQAIYGFRGADTKSLGNIGREFGAVRLPLTVSYRCPQAVVAEAHKFVSHIQAAPSAPMGTVETLSKYTAKDFTASDAILCRNTGPLVSMAFALIGRGVGCRVLGREIGQGLIALVDKMKAKTLDGLDEKLDAYLQRETAKYLAKNQEAKADQLNDKVATIRVFMGQLVETRRTIGALKDSIEALFSDNGKGLLTLCTIHKAKGLEWPTVYILDANLMPSKWARQDWQLEQETNLQYVAVTRAKATLRYIYSDGIRDETKAA